MVLRVSGGRLGVGGVSVWGGPVVDWGVRVFGVDVVENKKKYFFLFFIFFFKKIKIYFFSKNIKRPTFGLETRLSLGGHVF